MTDTLSNPWNDLRPRKPVKSARPSLADGIARNIHFHNPFDDMCPPKAAKPKARRTSAKRHK